MLQLIQGLTPLSSIPSGGIATLGNFDGVHKAHQQMINRVVAEGKRLNRPSIVIVFEPQPTEFFTQQPPARLTSLEEKTVLLTGLGVDYLVCLPFDEIMAQLSAEAFVQDILVGKLRLKSLLVGDDFRFGHERQGDFALLTTLGERFGFTTEAMSSIMDSGQRISSTRVRERLKAGDFSGVAELLGRPYTLSGTVVHGDKRGRLLGYPTANVLPGRKVLPVKGVFAVRVHGIDDRVYEGMANIGTRPTVDGLKTLIEVNLFDFDQSIYDKKIEIEFCKKVRDEQVFANIDALKSQLHLDKTQVEAYFTHG